MITVKKDPLNPCPPKATALFVKSFSLRKDKKKLSIGDALRR
jgi:hypothetical protein